MVKYELQKLFSRPLGKGALVVLAAVVALTTFFACSVHWTDQEGQNHTGPAAARQLRQRGCWTRPCSVRPSRPTGM